MSLLKRLFDYFKDPVQPRVRRGYVLWSETMEAYVGDLGPGGYCYVIDINQAKFFLPDPNWRVPDEFGADVQQRAANQVVFIAEWGHDQFN